MYVPAPRDLTGMVRPPVGPVRLVIVLARYPGGIAECLCNEEIVGQRSVAETRRLTSPYRTTRLLQAGGVSTLQQGWLRIEITIKPSRLALPITVRWVLCLLDVLGLWPVLT